MVSMLLAGLTLTSCKNKADDGDDAGADDTVATDTLSGYNVNETPADTVITDKDTVVEMGTKNDSKENAVGTQVP
ncbi:hypothetical protein [Flavobacterium subsaxonicum]|nr:hypothetical protein [Flavobacterium subsaxonicum]